MNILELPVRAEKDGDVFLLITKDNNVIGACYHQGDALAITTGLNSYYLLKEQLEECKEYFEKLPKPAREALDKFMGKRVDDLTDRVNNALKVLPTKITLKLKVA